MSSLFAGTKRFQVVRRIGAGAMGVVYEAVDRETDTPVALKTLHTMSGDALLRLKTEFRSLRDLQHPNLVTLGELRQENGHWFFTMELIHGCDFLEYVGRRRGKTPESISSINQPTTRSLSDITVDYPLPWGIVGASDDLIPYEELDEARLRNALGQLVCGLRVLHEADKVHRDVKPSNCLVTPEGRVVVLDFGLIADLTTSRRWGPEGDLVGTVPYMAPEQAASKEVGPATDLYSVGVVLYECLTSIRPFSGPAVAILERKQFERPLRPREYLPEVPEDLDALCMDLLAIDPAERPSAEDVIERLGFDASETIPLDSKQKTDPPISTRRPKTNPRPIFVGRIEELDTLWRAYKDSRQQAVRTFVLGESGMGKTALIAEFTEQLRRQQPAAVVLPGRCHEREAVPYKAFDGVVDALSQYLCRISEEQAIAILPRFPALLVQMFPVLERVDAIANGPRGPLSRSFQDRDHQELRSRVFVELRELLGKLAERTPLVLIIEDIQWTDADSLALLETLMRPPEAPNLLLVMTLRTSVTAAPDPTITNNAPLSAFVADLDNDTRRIELSRLSGEESCQLAERLRPEHSAWDLHVAQHLADASEGHPLFLEELVHAIADREQPPAEALALEDALWTRIEQLAPAYQSLLAIVCTAGRPLKQSLAAAAAKVAAADVKPMVRPLQLAKLVRTNGPQLSDFIEPYHDRVRAAVVAHIAPETRRGYHRAIAEVLAANNADPEQLWFHWGEAGVEDKAARYATAAATAAAEALAFDRAAYLYRQALANGACLSDASRRQVQIGLGDALTNAGRGREAAEAYVEAAAGADAELAIELKRRAVEQWLRSGHLHAGLDTLRVLLDEIGVRLPTTRTGAKAALMRQLLWLRWRGISFRERGEAEIDGAELMKIDVCWSVAAGAAMANPAIGLGGIARNLQLSLRAGEPYRLSRALSLQIMFLAAVSPKVGPQTETMRELAHNLANRAENPHAIALAIMAEGFVHYWSGDWKRALAVLDRADAMFREECTNITSGSPLSRLLALWSLLYLGDLPQLLARLRHLMRQAEERGDLQTTVNLGVSFSHIEPLASDDPERAYDAIDVYAEQWQSEHFYFPDWYALQSRVEVDLYRGNAAQANTRFAEAWHAAKSSSLLLSPKLRVDSTFLRARCDLALAVAANTAPAARKRLLGRANAAAQRIEREAFTWSEPLSRFVYAAVAALQGQDQVALTHLARAAKGFDKASMALYASVARYRRGQLLGGDQGQRLSQDAQAVLQERGIRNPEAFAACLIPGFTCG